MPNRYDFDVLVIGGGAAGLSLALNLPRALRIGVLIKTGLQDNSSYYAQGGIAAVLDEADSFDAHINDTLNAGAGLCDLEAVRFTVEHAPQAIEWLTRLGMPFTCETAISGQHTYHLTREGGHNNRRVLHATDATGQALQTTLHAEVTKHKNIVLLDNRVAIDLITGQKLGLSTPRCLGVYAYQRSNGRVEHFSSRFTALATGGANKAYLYSSNPDVSTGDGIAMGWRAGCRIANMEFMQFHPTCLYHPAAKSFLISEALRGEGARLLLPNGRPFMHKFDARAELAPRDIVARAIDHEMKRLGIDYVLLDISHKPAAFIQQHFPNILQRALQFGFDITNEPLPVVPAAHYTCGGIVTDLRGRSDIPGLYALGETAYTGLHGANRLASNSLLECLVFARAAAEDIAQQLSQQIASTVPELPPWDESRVSDSDEEIVVAHNWHELRQTMWSYVGIVRTDKRLQRAARRIRMLEEEVNEYYVNFRVSNDLLELRNLITVCQLIVACAQQRKESRGLHYTLDYPHSSDCFTKATILTPQNFISPAAVH